MVQFIRKMKMNGPLELEEIKKLQLGILADVAGFCERNSLKYYLAYGTLLGAVRTKGTSRGTMTLTS